jgi:hypothetical protein
MPPSIAPQNRLENLVTSLTMAINTLEIIADSIQTPFLGAIINTTQAVLENIQVSFVEETCIDVKFSHSLDCYQTQRWLCSASGANPQIAECNHDSLHQVRCRWRNAYRSSGSCWEIHRVLALFVENPLYTNHWNQDPSQNLHFCRGPTKGEQSEKLLPAGWN